MKTLAIFPQPEDAAVMLEHDSGPAYTGILGQADGRQAQLLSVDETLPDGWGAWLTIKWPDNRTLRQHGVLRLYTRSDGRAVFEADVFEAPESF